MTVASATAVRAGTQPPLRRSDALLLRRVLDELLILGPTGEVVVLAGTAAQVWRALEDHDDVSGLVDELSETFRVPATVVADDVHVLLHELAERDLLMGAVPSEVDRGRR